MSNGKSDSEVCCVEISTKASMWGVMENNIKQIQKEATDDISNSESLKEEFRLDEVDIQMK